jgi:hypothetical protein
MIKKDKILNGIVSHFDLAAYSWFIDLQSPSFPHAFSGNPGEFFGLDPR